MSDPVSVPQNPVAHPPFPVTRLLYAILCGVFAWIVLHIVFVLAAVQFLVHAINGKPNEDIKSFSASLAEYLRELLAYMAFAREEQPFPLGPFPKPA
jgi:Domain of unknown function (DUF4389)